jgi:hypothetical protein
MNNQGCGKYAAPFFVVAGHAGSHGAARAFLQRPKAKRQINFPRQIRSETTASRAYFG